MRLRSSVFLLGLFFLGFSLTPTSHLQAQELPSIPNFSSWVVDTTSTLSPPQKQSLHSKLESFQKKHGSQVAVLIIDTTNGKPIEEYCLRVAESWKVGQKDKDNDVIVPNFKSKNFYQGIDAGTGAVGSGRRILIA